LGLCVFGLFLVCFGGWFVCCVVAVGCVFGVWCVMFVLFLCHVCVKFLVLCVCFGWFCGLLLGFCGWDGFCLYVYWLTS